MPSSSRSEALLRQVGLPVVDLNEVDLLDAYVDGADEINADLQMVKGGGAALTREKILPPPLTSSSALRMRPNWWCWLFPVEVIPMARSQWPENWLSWGPSLYGERVPIPTTVTGYWICTVYQLGVQMSWRGRSKRYLASYAAVYSLKMLLPVDKVFGGVPRQMLSGNGGCAANRIGRVCSTDTASKWPQYR